MKAFVFSIVLFLFATPMSFANPKGKQMFETYCAACHGKIGIGDGPAAIAMPKDKKPRNLAKAKQYKKGSDLASILKTIENGIPGTMMTPWKAAISSLADRKAIAQYVKSLQK